MNRIPNKSPLIKTIVFVVIFAGNMFGLSCIQETREPSGEVEGFDELTAKYQEVVDQIPHHPDSLQILSALKSAVVDREESTDEEAILQLIAEATDSPVALYALTEYCERSGIVQCLDLCRQVQDSFKGEAVSALALELTANHLKAESPDQFIALCDRMIETGDRSKENRTAALLRYEYLEELGKSKEASLDALRIVSQFPSWAERAGLNFEFASVLDRAGFHIEADAIRLTGDKKSLMDGLFDYLQSAGQRDNSLANHYYGQSPNLDDLFEIPIVSQENRVDLAYYWVRVARVAFHNRDSESILSALDSYLNELQANASAIAEEPAGSAHLVEIGELFLKSLSTTLDVSNLVGDTLDSANRRSEVNDLRRAVGILNSCQSLVLAARAEHAVADGEDAYFEAIADQVAFCKSVNLHQAVVEAYSHFIDRFPNSPRSPSFLYSLGEYYQDEMGVPSLGMKTFERTRESYTNTAEAERSTLRIALYRYEQGKHEAALREIQEFIDQYPKSGLVPNALFILAAVESALGLVEDAEIRMLELADTHREHQVASRALFWVGNSRLGRQDYDGASQIFSDLSHRFPESAEARQAEGLLSRLENVTQ